MIKPEDVTIIIPHLGASPEAEYSLVECLKSLDETVPDIRKILVKNGYNQCEHYNDINMNSQGQCRAVNAAVATTNTPWIFVTNDDMIYAPEWWEQLSSPVDSLELLCASPKLVEPRKGAPTFEVYFCGGAGGDFDKQKFLDYVESKGDFDKFNMPLEVTGFNLPFLIKRELWDTIGGYDINYDPWGSNSDSDLEYKIKLAGVQPYQVQNSFVYHFSQTSGTFNPENNEYYQRNFAYFKEKWGFDRTDDGIWEADFLIPTPEQGRIFQPSWENKYK